MNKYPNIHPDLGICVPRCVLPSSMKAHLLEHWVTIACDQYTSDIDYWAGLYKKRRNMPSTLHLVMPEVFCVEPRAVLTPVELLLFDEYEKTGREERAEEMFELRMRALKRVMIDRVNRRMIEYVEDGTLVERDPEIIYVERTLFDGSVRKGLVMAVDLEKYDFSEGSQALIRPTEKTIPERIIPRLEVREGASLELPHILCFVDDQEDEMIEPIRDNLKNEKQEPLYKFSFVLKGKANFISGWTLPKKEEERVLATMRKFISPEAQMKKYGVKENTPPILFAVGDGNHSLATAKAHWEKVKQGFKKLKVKPRDDHPARYALVEVISLYDRSIDLFEPIHRCVRMNFSEIQKKLEAEGVEVIEIAKDKDIPLEELRKAHPKEHFIPFYSTDKKGYLHFKKTEGVLEVATLQKFLDRHVNEKLLDYIHGEKEAIKMAKKREDHCTFILPNVEKSDLFVQVVRCGVCPRKTFSIGHAQDKRVYMECRYIVRKNEITDEEA